MENIGKPENKKPRKTAIENIAGSPQKTKNKLEKKVLIKNIKKINKKPAKFRLNSTGYLASLCTPINERVPLMLTDIQHLLLHSLLGNLNITETPRWYVLDQCHQIKQATCLILEGLSTKHWYQHKHAFECSSKIFEDCVEILTPSVYNGSLVQELALVPLSESDKMDIISKYGSMNLALEARKDLNVMMKAVFPIEEKTQTKEDSDYINSLDKFARTQLILSAWQLIEENYPVPLKGKLQSIYSDYVFTKEEYKPVTSTSPMFGLDCEMCLTNAGSELTRVSVVNEKHETVYDTFVKPYNDITNYLTRFSGITKAVLDNVTKRLPDVQEDLKRLLPPDAILVGQSLNLDLHALKMMHPYIIDTSLIYNLSGQRTRKPKLKILAKEFLNEEIQCSNKGHCSIEDSLASLKLVQLKLNNSMDFGDAVHTNRSKYKEKVSNLCTSEEYALSIFNHIIEQKKSSLVVGCENITGDYHAYMTQAKNRFYSQLKKGKPKKVKLCTVDDIDQTIPTLVEALNDFNLTMAHLKVDSQESNVIDKIDKWIENISENLKQTTVFVVVFGGSDQDNGMAMVSVKNVVHAL